MNSIQHANGSFPFNQLTLGNPTGLQGGSYFSKLLLNGEPLYVQVPKCATKSAIKKTEKKIYVDLMFSNEQSEFIEWITGLEKRLQDLIFENKDAWFQTELERDDIENFFNSPVRIYQGNKYLVRSNIGVSKLLDNKPLIQIFTENEEEKTIDDVLDSHKVICIIEVLGIHFSSRSHFQIDIQVKQMMLLEEKPLFTKCLIQKDVKPIALEMNIPKVSHEETNIPLQQPESQEQLKEAEQQQVPLPEPEENKEQKTTENIKTVDASEENIKLLIENNTEDAKIEENSTVAEMTGEEVVEQNSDHANDKEETDEQPTLHPGGEENEDHKDELNALETLDSLDNINSEKEVKQNIVDVVENDEQQREVKFQEEGEIIQQDETADAEEDKITESKELEKESEVSDNNLENPASNLERMGSSNHLEEITITPESLNQETLTLKKPSDVYYEIYKEARTKAKEAKRQAIDAYLELKNIRTTYALHDIDSSDDEFEEMFNSE